MSDPATGTAAVGPGQIEAFWDLARFHARLNVAPAYFGPTTLEMVPPPAWSFGSSPAQADALLALVLAGTKTATASALSDYEPEEPLPEIGALGIVLDGAGHPRALIETTGVTVVALEEVDAEHARLEGEGDGTLGHWRAVHEQFFATGSSERALDPTMPVVLERFRVVYRGD